MRFSFRVPRNVRAVAVAGLALLAVAATATASDAGPLQRLLNRGKTAPADTAAPASPAATPSDKGPLVIDPDALTDSGYCPELHLQVDGESLATFDPGHDNDAKYARYLGSITQSARECHSVTDTSVSLKVGISGRVVAGPKGAPGKVSLPVRVTVIKQHGEKVMFDKVYTATITVAPGDLAGTFSQVFDPIQFKRTANDEDLIVYVGFDQKKKPDAAGTTG